MGGFRDCNKVKQKSNRVTTACRLDKRDREELEVRAEILHTTVGELVEKYVLAGLRVDRSGENEQRILFERRGFYDPN